MKSLRLILAVTLSMIFIVTQGYCQPPVIDESDEYSLATNMHEALDVKSIAKSAEIDEEAWQNESLTVEQPLVRDSAHEDGNIDSDSLAEQVHNLQAEIQELRGQLEVQAHDLKMLQQQQLAFYKDLDSRLQKQKSESGPDTASSRPLPITFKTTVKDNNKRGNPADEQISYLAAFELIKAKQFDQALNAMQKFTEDYPASGYSANAHYWIGELYLVKNENERALQAFNTVLAKFPKSSKAADSELKAGYAMANLGETGAARSRLQRLINQYPDTKAAQLAKQKLDSMN